MNVPNVVYGISMILSIITISLEVVTCVLSAYHMHRNCFDSVAPALNDTFKSGIKIRNSSGCFLVLLFFISNKKTVFGESNVLVAIANISRIFAIGSIVVFGCCVILSLLTAIKKNGSAQTKAFINLVWRSSLFTMLFGFCIANLFYVP